MIYTYIHVILGSPSCNLGGFARVLAIGVPALAVSMA